MRHAEECDASKARLGVRWVRMAYSGDGQRSPGLVTPTGTGCSMSLPREIRCEKNMFEQCSNLRGIASGPCSLVSYNACHAEIPRAHDDSTMRNYLNHFFDQGVPMGFTFHGVTFGFCGVTFWWRCAMQWGDL